MHDRQTCFIALKKKGTPEIILEIEVIQHIRDHLSVSLIGQAIIQNKRTVADHNYLATVPERVLDRHRKGLSIGLKLDLVAASGMAFLILGRRNVGIAARRQVRILKPRRPRASELTRSPSTAGGPFDPAVKVGFLLFQRLEVRYRDCLSQSTSVVQALLAILGLTDLRQVVNCRVVVTPHDDQTSIRPAAQPCFKTFLLFGIVFSI